MTKTFNPKKNKHQRRKNRPYTTQFPSYQWRHPKRAIQGDWYPGIER